LDYTNYIKDLFQRYLDNTITASEVSTLLKHFDIIEREDLLEDIIQTHLKSLETSSSSSIIEDEPILNTIYEDIKKQISAGNGATQKNILHFYKQNWLKLSAAAVLFFLIAGSIFLLFMPKEEKVLVQEIQSIEQEQDIPSGKQNAFLTLDDGTRIMLDSAANGRLTQQGNIDIQKIDGEISYQKNTHDNMKNTPVYNTINTANGNQYQLILTDGSKVWLNAASSIRFPTSFIGEERRVEITGEVYFEVAKDGKRTFIVGFNNQKGEKGEIEVLGTHFNVNAYSEESSVKTTLLEGSVKILNAGKERLLTPGQQAELTKAGITLNKKVDIQQVMAWKNGFFSFNSTDIYSIMRQVGRWYNVEVIFEGNFPKDNFSGMISRDAPISAILKALEMNDVEVERVGRTITIKP
jgi:hypothetical protein